MPDESEAFFRALIELEVALEANAELAERMRERISDLREARKQGRPLKELVASEKPPLIVQLLTSSAGALQASGSHVRRTEARALYAEGLTMDEIARLFGVTRQRVSALLRESNGSA